MGIALYPCATGLGYKGVLCFFVLDPGSFTSRDKVSRHCEPLSFRPQQAVHRMSACQVRLETSAASPFSGDSYDRVDASCCACTGMHWAALTPRILLI